MSIITVNNHLRKELSKLSDREFETLSEVSYGFGPLNKKKEGNKANWVKKFSHFDVELNDFASTFTSIVNKTKEKFPEVSKKVIREQMIKLIKERQRKAGARPNFNLIKLECMKGYVRHSAKAS